MQENTKYKKYIKKPESRSPCTCRHNLANKNSEKHLGWFWLLKLTVNSNLETLSGVDFHISALPQASH